MPSRPLPPARARRASKPALAPLTPLAPPPVSPPGWPSGGPYRVILADPPWCYWCFANGRSGAHGAAEHHYPTMSDAELAALPVAALADPRGSALLLWATYPCLTDALALMAAWGFQFKTVAFTWVKRNKSGGFFLGLGHYTRGNAEICLLGTRGRPLKRRDASVEQLIISTRREHSRKSDQQYERIERLFGADIPRLELFARTAWPGWDSYGREVGKFPVQPQLAIPA